MLSLLTQTTLRLWDFVLPDSCNVALSDSVVNIVMIAMPESVEHKNIFSSNLKRLTLN